MIAAMRRESRAAMRKRQVLQLELSDGLAGPDVARASAAILAGPPETVAVSSFEELAWAPRSYMHATVAGGNTALPASGDVRRRQAGMEAALELYAAQAPPGMHAAFEKR
jgi:hypothetical protein